MPLQAPVSPLLHRQATKPRLAVLAQRLQPAGSAVWLPVLRVNHSPTQLTLPFFEPGSRKS